jgi:ubiquinone/menaquinone biosynthesis C-methylase UbiE
VIDLSRRAEDQELLDEGVAPDEALRSLGDLRFVNRWLGNRGRLLQAVRADLESSPAPSLLDVGCGSGDVPVWIASQVGRPVSVYGVDIKPLHLEAAPAALRGVVADVHALPFPDGCFDVVTASLFLHHFDGPDVARVLRELYRVSRRALVVNDLRRARVPYVFGRATFPLMFRSRVSVEDGLLSIRRGFTRDELRQEFAAAGIAAQVESAWPYRLLAVAKKAA